MTGESTPPTQRQTIEQAAAAIVEQRRDQIDPATIAAAMNNPEGLQRAFGPRMENVIRAPSNDITFKGTLGELSNDKFFAKDFVENHVVREEPSPMLALEIAEVRRKEQSTLLFLPKAAFKALADDIRKHHKIWWRNPPKDQQLFFTYGTYSCITVTDQAGSLRAGDPKVSRLHFAVTEVGSIMVYGSEKEIYAISHLEGADDAVGNDDAAGYSEDEV